MTLPSAELPASLLQALQRAEHVVVLTGAGVSAESGIPTFRDSMDGLWAKYNPQELATPTAFARDPELVTRWYDMRRCKVAGVAPNAGHRALAQLQARKAAEGRCLTLVTQNVDRLHQAAGSTDVQELHGTLWLWRCTLCGEETEERGPAFTSFPLLCHCGGKKRPGVVWFGEDLGPGVIERAQRAAASCQLFMSIGTSSVVHPAAGLIDYALGAGAQVLEINPVATPVSDRVTWALRGKSAVILPQLVERSQ
jgi:NAD-dependent deacetylase